MASEIIISDALKAKKLYSLPETLTNEGWKKYYNAMERMLICHGTFCDGKECSNFGSSIPKSSCEYITIMMVEICKVKSLFLNENITRENIANILDGKSIYIKKVTLKTTKASFHILLDEEKIRGPKIIIDKLKRLHKGPKENFGVDATNCLLRYSIINGWDSNYQLALPNEYRKIYQLEIFASPFNVVANNWYSLFPDVDAPFGCTGKWIKGMKIPKDPAIEANCPFIECIQDAFVEDVLSQMKDSKSILIVIADWKDSKAYKALESSPHLVNGMRPRSVYYSPDDLKIPMPSSVECLLSNM